MKIMQINCTYRAGSTGKMMYDIHTYLVSNSAESFMCYGRGKRTEEKNVIKLCPEIYAKFQNLFSRISGLMYGGCLLSTNKLIRLIRRESPDIVHLHCINGYFVNVYRLIGFLKANNIKTVLTLHAEFMYTANCGHAYECDGWLKGCGSCPRLYSETKSLLFDRTADSFKKMKNAFDGFENDLRVVSVSPWLMERASRSPILKNMHHLCVLNGIDTETFYARDASFLIERFAERGQKLVLFVTAFFSDACDHPKGGAFLAELARRMPDVKFLVAGKYSVSSHLPENIELLGNIDDMDLLSELYSAADLSLVLSKRETFSMPVAESLCCGTRVVGFFSGAPEMIAIPEYSRFVEYGNVDALEDAVRCTLAQETDSCAVSEVARKKYSAKIMASEYADIYGELYESKKN